MLKFKYCGTHVKDEKYMNEMSSKGGATKSLIEGFWIFDKCKPNEYKYRIYYCPIVLAILIILSFKVSNIFLILTFLSMIYYIVCLYLLIEYTLLINELK